MSGRRLFGNFCPNCSCVHCCERRALPEPISFTIQGEACSKANSRNLVTIDGKPQFIKSKKALQFEADAIKQIPGAARRMLAEPVRVALRMHYANHVSDLDESIVLDVLQARWKRIPGPLIDRGNGEYAAGPSERVMTRSGVYLNDRQVREKHVYHAIDKRNPRVEVVVEPIGPKQPELSEVPDVPRGAFPTQRS